MPNRGHQHWVKKGMVQLEVTKARSLVLAFFGIFFVNFLAIYHWRWTIGSVVETKKNPCGEAWGINIQGSDRHREPLCWIMTIGNGTSNQPINQGITAIPFLWHIQVTDGDSS
jgi:hypothetical protein